MLTRIRKLDAGEVDATLLALAGLKRLGMADVATEILGTDQFLPAVGQGAIGITGRADDEKTSALLGRINHAPTLDRLTTERAMLAALDGSCRTPIAGLAELEGYEGTIPAGDLAETDDSSYRDAMRFFHKKWGGPAVAVCFAGSSDICERSTTMRSHITSSIAPPRRAPIQLIIAESVRSHFTGNRSPGAYIYRACPADAEYVGQGD